MNSRIKPRGLSATGWLLLIVIVGGFASVGAKLVPHYMDFSTASNILDNLSQQQGMVNKRTSDIKAMVLKRLKLNNIRDYNLNERMKVKRTADRIIVNLDYEVRVPLVGNSFVLLVFKHTVQLRD